MIVLFGCKMYVPKEAQTCAQWIECLQDHFQKHFVARWLQAVKKSLSKNVCHTVEVYYGIIGNRKDDVCLQLQGQVSSQPMHCCSAVLDL